MGLGRRTLTGPPCGRMVNDPDVLNAMKGSFRHDIRSSMVTGLSSNPIFKLTGSGLPGLWLGSALTCDRNSRESSVTSVT